MIIITTPNRLHKSQTIQNKSNIFNGLVSIERIQNKLGIGQPFGKVKNQNKVGGQYRIDSNNQQNLLYYTQKKEKKQGFGQNQKVII
ncbi:unnamed protein product [Paramecium pentaurelia]|uniref:Uncharacterized protein n=1 Tax=Paramecium pentaurelia TaxID=43138 RepID=A0A8S1YHY5_9CILI|nr:unnamed protein product [Paramecium pentaurelia]